MYYDVFKQLFEVSEVDLGLSLALQKLLIFRTLPLPRCFVCYRSCAVAADVGAAAAADVGEGVATPRSRGDCVGTTPLSLGLGLGENSVEREICTLGLMPSAEEPECIGLGEASTEDNPDPAAACCCAMVARTAAGGGWGKNTRCCACVCNSRLWS